MPIYEYKCKACDHRLEKLQRMSDDPLKDCPECEQPELTKLVSAVAFRLTGTGWYETDFKNNNKSDKNSNKNNGQNSNPKGNKNNDKSASGSNSESTKKVVESSH